MALVTYLDVSTGYVTRDDMDALVAGDGPTIAAYPEGAILYVTDDPDDPDLDGFSPRFRDLLAYARERGAYLVRLDAAGDDALPTLTYEEW